MYGRPYRFASDSNLRSFLFSLISSKFLLESQSYQFLAIAHAQQYETCHLDQTVHAVDANALNSRCFVTTDRSPRDILDP
jgi:hypothetical protein